MQMMILAAATVLAVGWLALAVRYRAAYDNVIAAVDGDTFPLSELFLIGFGIMDLIHFNMRSDRSRRRIREIAEVRGRKYAEFYYYTVIGAEFTYGYTALALLLLLSALAQTPVVALFGVALAVLAVLYVEEQLDNALTDRRDELLADFPQVLSKLTLLVNSGMVMRDAWTKVSETGNGVLYREMQTARQEFQNGTPELEVYRNFAERCAIKEIRRFSSTMIQNLQKGNAEIAYFLREMADEMWEEKKHMVKRKGEAANSKLMLPTGMIFIGILIMVVVPVFAGM